MSQAGPRHGAKSGQARDVPGTGPGAGVSSNKSLVQRNEMSRSADRSACRSHSCRLNAQAGSACTQHSHGSGGHPHTKEYPDNSPPWLVAVSHIFPAKSLCTASNKQSPAELGSLETEATGNFHSSIQSLTYSCTHSLVHSGNTD